MTDHRAEAERWLEAARSPNSTNEVATTFALIAIGHALLANPLPIPSGTVDDRCPWWTDGSSWALWTGSPAKRRCVLYAGHQGDHSDPPKDRG